MNDYFNLIAAEFVAQSGQIKQFVKSHGPTIGAAHEILLRSFLKKYLPRWVSVGHGFILSHGNVLSKECDIIVYNSTYYSPLYQIDDFVVLAPESVVAVVEVKTVLTRKMLHDAMNNLSLVKAINSNIDTSLFVYRPPSLKTIFQYLRSYNFQDLDMNCIPDGIYGMSKYALVKARGMGWRRNEDDEPTSIAFVTEGGDHAQSIPGYVFETFYYGLYQQIERAINSSIKDGIDIDWIVNEKETKHPVEIHSRFRYATPEVLGLEGWGENIQMITVKEIKA